jgi:type IV secretory pathway ATPase VirB11/archaellum biosynthesis ATPase
MLFDKKTGKCQYEVERTGEGKVIKVNCIGCPKFPSIENDPLCMRQTLSKLIEVPDAIRVVFSQAQDYDYNFDQTRMLAEIARVYAHLIKKKEIFALGMLGAPDYPNLVAPRYAFIKSIIYKMVLEDPISAYVKIKREMREVKIQRDKRINEKLIKFDDNYINGLNYVVQLLEQTGLIKKVKPQLAGFKIGDRQIYSKLFNPTIKPNFMYTKLMAAYPEGGEELGNYTVGDTEVTVFKVPGSVQYLYHMMPPEFRLNEEHFNLVNSARDIMAEHKPTKEEFVEPDRMREVFKHVGTDLLTELATSMKIKLTDKELDDLSEILIRYTIGFGLIEVLMNDENIQDVTINSPYGTNPMFLVHGHFGNCVTNIYPTATESESWATKLRLVSGKLPGASTRVAAITNPLNPTGIAFAFRRHRAKPWTLPLFIDNRMLNPLAAGLLSFIIDGTRTILIAGTRSSGKSSFLGSMMIELMRRYRIITVEDTLELPVPAMRRLGYNIQSLKVSSALGLGQAEVSAENGIRATLRLGDSSLIIGEVRSTEAKALFEAMRVGAAANVVAGTIHAASPYGVFDRVVNDIGVPPTSFKATDIIVITNPVRSAGGLKKVRRVLQISEIRKDWTKDPKDEAGFVDLMVYNPETDELEPTPEFINGDSDILKDIAGSVKQWAGKWDAVWENIQLRAECKKKLVEYAKSVNKPSILEAEFVVKANDEFHNISEEVLQETGELDNKKILSQYDRWLRKEIKLTK